MLSPEPRDSTIRRAEELFDGLLSTSARTVLARSGFISLQPSSSAEVANYVRHFSRRWSAVGDGFSPNPDEVLKQMDEREAQLFGLWKLALRDDFPAGDSPLVAQAPVRYSSNPLIIRSSVLQRPLIVMSEGLWTFACYAVMGILHWAEGEGHREEFGMQLFKKAAASWVRNNPRIGPTGDDAVEATTMDMETAVFGAGIADAVFTWAFLHEMGHHALGHLPESERPRGMSADGTTSASTPAYSQQHELAADAFALDRYLGLMPYSDEIRRTFRFGPQIDHAPVVLFELIDLACRAEGALSLLEADTHPAPLARAAHLLGVGDERFSKDGREWYEYWAERMAAFRRAVLR